MLEKGGTSNCILSWILVPSCCLVLASARMGAVDCDARFDCLADYPPGAFPDFDCEFSDAAAGIDWPRWRRVFEETDSVLWFDESYVFLSTFAESDPEQREQYRRACPLGHLNANIMMYVLLKESGDTTPYFTSITENVVRFPLRILAGSRWPLFLFFWRWNLTTVGSPRSYNPADDDIVNCAHLVEPVVDWVQVQKSLVREDGVVRSLDAVYLSPENSRVANAECPYGWLAGVFVKALMCAVSESTCFGRFASFIEEWFQKDTDTAVLMVAHSRWPFARLLDGLARATRHHYKLDFTEQELRGLAPGGSWIESRSFRDVQRVVKLLPAGPPEAPTLTYVTIVHGGQFNRHIPRFCARARVVGHAGRRLLLFTLDEEAFAICMKENEGRCIRGTPSIINKFTLPLILLHAGLDVVWIDFDVFLMQDPTPEILDHANHGPFELLVSGSFESDCICNGIVYYRSTTTVRNWLFTVLLWMYHHPYEHDQKTFAAFLAHRETVQEEPLDMRTPLNWDILDAVNQFVTPDVFEGNGWMGDLDHIVIFHFLNGQSDSYTGLDPSGEFMRQHGKFVDGVGPGKLSLLDLFYGQADDSLYTTMKPAHENAAIRGVLLSSRKKRQRRDLFGKSCGPVPEWGTRH